MITIYTDGACSGNPGIGGWGAVIIKEKKITHLSGGLDETTNNQMELTAAIEALNEPGGLPSIEKERSYGEQFNLDAPNPNAAQPNEALYNPFEGQYYIGPNGEKIPRTPTNSSMRSGG